MDDTAVMPDPTPDDGNHDAHGGQGAQGERTDSTQRLETNPANPSGWQSPQPQSWLEPKTVAAGAAGLAALCLVLTLASLSIAISARSQLRAAQEDAAQTRTEASQSLRTAADLLDTLSRTSLDVNVQVDETVPINATLPVEETFLIPLKTSIPVQQTVTATVEVDGLFGPRDSEVSIPLDLQVPIDVEVPFTFDEPIDLSTETRVVAEVPVQLDLGATELGPLSRDLGDELVDLAVSIEESG